MRKRKPSSPKNQVRPGKPPKKKRPKPPHTRPLTAQQERFAVALAKGDSTATQCAILAGYSERYAASQASQLLKNSRVAARVRRLQSLAARRAEIEVGDVLRELGVIGFSDIRNFAVDDDGRLVVADGVPDEAARAVSSIVFKRRVTMDGEPAHVDDVKITLWNKPEALKLLGQYLRMFVQLREHSGPGGGPIPVEAQPEDLSALSVDELKVLRDIRAKVDKQQTELDTESDGD